jgi:hypothetical protein
MIFSLAYLGFIICNVVQVMASESNYLIATTITCGDYCNNMNKICVSMSHDCVDDMIHELCNDHSDIFGIANDYGQCKIQACIISCKYKKYDEYYSNIISCDIAPNCAKNNYGYVCTCRDSDQPNDPNEVTPTSPKGYFQELPFSLKIGIILFFTILVCVIFILCYFLCSSTLIIRR